MSVSRHRQIGIILCCALLGSAPRLFADSDATDLGRIRPSTLYLQDILAAGYRESAHFRRIVDRLVRAPVIVHVTPAPTLPFALMGGLHFVTAAGGYRYLRIALRMDVPPRQLIAALAHELQHALEIADAPDIASDEALGRFYRARGERCRSLPRECYDTAAARAAGAAVYADLHSPVVE